MNDCSATMRGMGKRTSECGEVRRRARWLATLVLILGASSAALAAPTHHDVWKSGEDGYHTYRIPSVIRTKSGALLAFAEGRAQSSGDSGDIDLVMKRSTDGGRTWGAQSVLWDDQHNTCGNPCPVVIEPSGEILLLATYNLGQDHEGQIINKTSFGTRRVFVLRSGDEGRSWSAPREITGQAKDPSWGWYATGPGVSIQLRRGPHAGRIVVPANHSYDSPPEEAIRDGRFGYGAHVISSDDGGETWRRSAPIHPRVNESQVVELSDGRLMMNMRSYFGDGVRRIAFSDDGGATWAAPTAHEQLTEPVCQASILRNDLAGGNGPGALLFSNPPGARRENLTVRLSSDEGETWPAARVIGPGPAAYSCLVALDGDTAGCLYEAGRDSPYQTIRFTRFSLTWLREKRAE